MKRGLYGTCAASEHMTEQDLADPMMNMEEFRNEILLDWKEFQYDPRALYYVEKDIQNAVQTRFLQGLLGVERTAFVMTMRHPMSKCKNFKCNQSAPLKEFLLAWLQVYHTLEQDLQYLENYVVIQHEGVILNPQVTFSAICDVVGYNEIKYLSEQDKEMTVNCRSLGTTIMSNRDSRRLAFHGKKGFFGKGNNVIDSFDTISFVCSNTCNHLCNFFFAV
jgi:hypothetical protein